MSENELSWHRVADVDELPPGRVKTVVAGVHSMALTNIDGEFTAMENRCPHQGGPLGEGSIEIGADVLLKATKVDGVYDDDPVTNPDAKRFDDVTYDQVIEDKLRVMDATAIVMCRDNHLPIRVFDLSRANALVQAMTGDALGTLVTA